MADIDGKSLARRHSQLKTARATLDAHCQEIAQLVLPMLSTFGQDMNGSTKGDKRTQKLMESTAPLALTRYASAVEGFLTPRGERWSKLTTNNKELNKSSRVKQYFSDANDLLFDVRYDPRAGFQSQIHECITGVGSFGTAGLFVDGKIRDGQRGNLSSGTTYTSTPLINIYISQGANGAVDTVHREWSHSARNCIADFGDECPEEIRNAAEKEPDKEFRIVHVVMPNTERKIGALGPRGMPFASYYLWLDKSEIISRGGYNTLRYAVARGTKAPGEHYGRSPAMTVLAEIKSINEMRRSLLRAQHMTLNPPTLIHSELGANLKLRPGDQNFGMVSADGRPLAIPFQMGNQFPPTEREMERIRTVINDAFLITLFQILIERPQQTATESLQRAKEQAVLISPLIGKLQSEFLGQIIESELDILSVYGALPQMPPELIEAQGEYSITYQSDIVRALSAGEVEAYHNFMSDIAPMAQVKPEILETVDHLGIARDLAEKRGIPIKFIRTEDQMNELLQQQQQQQQQANVLPAAEQLANIDQMSASAEQKRAGARR